MRKFAIRLLTLAIYATALAMVPTVAPAKTETSSSRHIKKHKKSHGFSVPRSADQAWPVSRPSSQTGAACSRGFECAKWPPPMYEDPQRNPDGGGM
jgi:hypothetical protein